MIEPGYIGMAAWKSVTGEWRGFHKGVHFRARTGEQARQHAERFYACLIEACNFKTPGASIPLVIVVARIDALEDFLPWLERWLPVIGRPAEIVEQ